MFSLKSIFYFLYPCRPTPVIVLRIVSLFLISREDPSVFILSFRNINTYLLLKNFSKEEIYITKLFLPQFYPILNSFLLPYLLPISVVLDIFYFNMKCSQVSLCHSFFLYLLHSYFMTSSLFLSKFFLSVFWLGVIYGGRRTLQSLYDFNSVITRRHNENKRPIHKRKSSNPLHPYLTD